jgi:hypothetical protein
VTFRLFNYPQQAIFGKVLPKSKIYEFAKPSNAVKELFVKQVEQIIWEYKLSPETINIPPGEGVQEIQILKIQSKVPELDEEVYRTIDEAIPSNVFCEVMLANKVKLVAAYKRPSEADASKWVTGVYFQSGWVSSSNDRSNIPVALHMGGLYSQMLQALMQGNGRAGEALKDRVDRLELIGIKTNELTRLKIKMSKERQFNRRVVINSQIKAIQADIDQLNIG